LISVAGSKTILLSKNYHSFHTVPFGFKSHRDLNRFRFESLIE
jgi:hypothetical protein